MGLLTRFFRARVRFHFASAFTRSSFETVSTFRNALSNRSNFETAPRTRAAAITFLPAHLILSKVCRPVDLRQKLVVARPPL
jgi:hypothetical protein